MEVIDMAAAHAHAWLDGYSLGAAGREYEPSRYFDGEAAAQHRRGYDLGRRLYLNPAER